MMWSWVYTVYLLANDVGKLDSWFEQLCQLTFIEYGLLKYASVSDKGLKSFLSFD